MCSNARSCLVVVVRAVREGVELGGGAREQRQGGEKGTVNTLG